MGRASNGNESGAPPKPSWGATDRKKAKKRHLTEGMTEETLTDLTVLLEKPHICDVPRDGYLSLGVVLETTAWREAKRGQSTNRKGEMSRASHE